MDEQQAKIVTIIKEKFEEKFEGNKLRFAKAADCDPKTLRDIFNGNHYMTMNLFLKLCNALEKKPSEILKEIEL